MRIYNKKGFVSGIITLLLCVLGVIAIILKGPSIKLVILLPFLLLISLTELRRSLSKSMSKEDIIKNNDERDKYILLKTSYKSLEILRSINFIVIMVSIILFAVTKSEFVLGIFVVSSIYMTLNFLVDLAVNIYYEKNE
ncbi:hypothetical protein [Clostridium butyricum]|uniref:hypothetical protein n=1 Tax=Clostridium butyricum TaxID=1492 RepID=UPI0018AA504E|nr:hypothetical protein [Clostridium butyricum]MDB2155063.1 hypothetical protein [Clostridium butyricum]MDB2158551.1 hypothetical protein [Clostridium butyricum]